MDKIYKKMKGVALDLFFPCFCLGCQKEGNYLCQDCRSILEISQYNYCLCGKNPIRLIQPVQSSKSGPRGKCPRCSEKKLSGLYFALPYRENFLTRKLIHQFKYKPYIKDLAKVLSSLIIEHLVLAKNNTEGIWQNSVLIPVPMEKKKMKSRNYNQSEELAKELSKILKVPALTDILKKTKETLPQTKLSKEDRAKNIGGAFAVKDDVEGAKFLKDKKIFLVDDVYTTGSTMEECAIVLKNHGVKTVWGISIAREG